MWDPRGRGEVAGRRGELLRGCQPAGCPLPKGWASSSEEGRGGAASGGLGAVLAGAPWGEGRKEVCTPIGVAPSPVGEGLELSRF